jgi:hypothetical protein
MDAALRHSSTVTPQDPNALISQNPNAPVTAPTAPAVGAGVTGSSSGATPPVKDSATASGTSADFGAVIASRMIVPGDISAKTDPTIDAAIALQKMLDAQEIAGNAQITSSSNLRSTEVKQRIKEAEDAIKALAASHGSFWGDFAKIAIDVLAIAIAVVGAVETGGTSLAIAAIVLTSLTAANDMDQMATGHGIAGQVAKAMGASDSAAGTADMIFGVALAIATAIVTAKANPNFAKDVQTYSAIAKGVGTAATAVENYQRAGEAANAQRDNAAKDRTDATIDFIDEKIQELLKILRTKSDAGAQVMNDTNDVLLAKGNSTSRIKATSFA